MTILELFKGELSLSDLLHQPLPLINDLVDAKIKIIEKRSKEELAARALQRGL